MANENETVESNYTKAMAKVDELCHKVVEDPRHYAASVIDDGCTYILPVIKILAIAEDSHKRELAAKDAEIARLKQEVENGIRDFANAVSGMVKRDALINELADALDHYVVCDAVRHDKCPECDLLPSCELIKKARAVVGNNRVNDGAEQGGEGK